MTVLCLVVKAFLFHGVLFRPRIYNIPIFKHCTALSGDVNFVKVAACESSNLFSYVVLSCSNVVLSCPELNNVEACWPIKFSPIKLIGERNARAYTPDKYVQPITFPLRGSYPS